MTARWITYWETGSVFPACVTHADRITAEAHALFVQAATGCTVHVREEEKA